MKRRKQLKERWPWKIGGNPKKRRFRGVKEVKVLCMDGKTYVTRRVCSNCEDASMSYYGLGDWVCENCGYCYN